MARFEPRSRLCALLVAALAGCATVRSVPVDAEGDRRSGAIEGIPYYLPRPYVAVKQPFPVGGRDLLVTATIDGNGNVLIARDALPKELEQLEELKHTNDGTIVPKSRIFLQGKPKKGETGSAGETPEDAGPEQTEGDEEPQGDEGDAEPKSGGKTHATGTVSPVVPISELFDIVYLPDFEERYVLRLRPRLGKLEANLGLQGGILGSLAVNVDNQAIASMVTDSVEAVVDVAKEVALGKLIPATSKEGDAVLQSKRDGAVTLRLRTTHEALPGLYPVLRPDEECLLTDPAQCPQDHAVATYGASTSTRTTTPSHDFLGATLVVPVGPYTRVAYRVRSTLVVELLDAQTVAARPEADAEKATTEPVDKEKVTTAVKQWISSAGLTKALGKVSIDVRTDAIVIRSSNSLSEKQAKSYEEKLTDARQKSLAKLEADLVTFVTGAAITVEGR
jgi:hypothetical protein